MSDGLDLSSLSISQLVHIADNSPNDCFAAIGRCYIGETERADELVIVVGLRKSAATVFEAVKNLVGVPAEMDLLEAMD